MNSETTARGGRSAAVARRTSGRPSGRRAARGRGRPRARALAAAQQRQRQPAHRPEAHEVGVRAARRRTRSRLWRSIRRTVTASARAAVVAPVPAQRALDRGSVSARVVEPRVGRQHAHLVAARAQPVDGGLPHELVARRGAVAGRGCRRSGRALPYECRAVQIDPGIFKAYDIRGLYGEQIDDEVAYAIGRAFVRVLARPLATSRPTSLNVGLGRDMRLTAPELAALYREGMIDEGAHVIDAGQVGTEMLYFLVGSRGLDGGLMCTASHNPKAYTGAKLVREGAIALSRRPGHPGHPPAHRGGPRRSPRRQRGTVEEVDLYDEFQAAAMKFIDPANVKPLKVVVDGGNGMAGPMVGPLLERARRSTSSRLLLGARRQLPRPRAQPAARARTASSSSTRSARPAPTSASPGTATPTAASSSTTPARSSTATSSPRSSPSTCSRRRRARRSSTTSAPRARSPTPSRRAGGTAHVNRVGHAFFKTRMRDEGAIFGGEVSGHYYFRDFYNADSGTVPALLVLEKLSVEGRKLSELVGDYRSKYFISGEINSTVDDADGARCARSRSGTPTREIDQARRRLGRLRRLALQRAPVEHRAAAAPEPRVARLARGHGAAARRGPGADPRPDARWYHTIELPDGTVTPGLVRPPRPGPPLRPARRSERQALPRRRHVGRLLGVRAGEARRRGGRRARPRRRGGARLAAAAAAGVASPRARRRASAELRARLGSAGRARRAERLRRDARAARLVRPRLLRVGAHPPARPAARARADRVGRAAATFISAEEYDRAASLFPWSVARCAATIPSAVVFWRPNLRAWRRMLWSAGFDRVERIGRFTLQATDGVKSRTSSTMRTSDRRRHPLHPDPHAVRGRARQHVPDRGRPADAGRHGPEQRQGARRARAGAARSRPPDRGPRAHRRHAPAHRPHGARRDPRPPLGRRGRGARRRSRRGSPTTASR